MAPWLQEAPCMWLQEADCMQEAPCMGDSLLVASEKPCNSNTACSLLSGKCQVRSVEGWASDIVLNNRVCGDLQNQFCCRG